MCDSGRGEGRPSELSRLLSTKIMMMLLMMGSRDTQVCHRDVWMGHRLHQDTFTIYIYIVSIAEVDL